MSAKHITMSLFTLADTDFAGLDMTEKVNIFSTSLIVYDSACMN